MSTNPIKTEIKISGMNCASCVVNLETALSKLKGVTKLNVNLASEKAFIDYDPNELTINTIENTITDLGFNVIHDKLSIKIGGMSCAMCVKSITKGLLKLNGISEVNVNLASEKVLIEYNKDLVTINDIKNVITDLGFQFLGLEENLPDSYEESYKKESQSKLYKIIIGFVVSLPLMAMMLLHIHTPIPMPYFMLIVSIIPFIYVSYPIFRAAYKSLKNHTLNMDVMYAMGIGVAFISSLMGTFNIILTPDFMFYETALMLASFLTLGRYLEANSKQKTSTAIKKLMGLQPKTAIRIKNNIEEKIDISDIILEDIILVKNGEKIPTDGVVIDGESYVDESMITGESKPVSKEKNSKIVGGTLNKNGILKFKATAIGKDTILSQIIKLVDEAQSSKPQVQKIADTAVSYFIPIVIIIAISSFVIWYYLLNSTLLFSLTTFISILVVACPCALGLATPTAVTVGIGRGAELGILIKTGDVLENLGQVNTVLFDKTGTLTKGKPEITDILTFNNTSEEELLLLTASIEKYSTHPLAETIVNEANSQSINLKESKNINTIPGKGIKGILNNIELLIGNESLLKENNISMKSTTKNKLDQLQNNGKTTIIISKNKEIIGIIGIMDSLKENSKKTISELKKMGLKTTMITGDNEKTANIIAKEIDIDNVISKVLPDQKASEVSKIQKLDEKVVFIGDGMNDAPALTQADVGIAIGNGTDIAMESGDVVLMSSDPLDVIPSIQLSKKIFNRIKENIFWAFIYNIILIPVAAGILYLPFHITFRPEYAGLAMALSSVTVVSLSLLLKNYTPDIKKEKTNNS